METPTTDPLKTFKIPANTTDNSVGALVWNEHVQRFVSYNDDLRIDNGAF